MDVDSLWSANKLRKLSKNPIHIKDKSYSVSKTFKELVQIRASIFKGLIKQWTKKRVLKLITAKIKLAWGSHPGQFLKANIQWDLTFIKDLNSSSLLWIFDVNHPLLDWTVVKVNNSIKPHMSYYIFFSQESTMYHQFCYGRRKEKLHAVYVVTLNYEIH